MAEQSNVGSETIPKPQILYRCKRCRRIVASQESIITHEPGKGEMCFDWKKRSDCTDTPKKLIDCTSIFVEPMKWMESVQEGHVQERLQCMGCKARLGYFNWAGMQCSCGAWDFDNLEAQRGGLNGPHGTFVRVGTTGVGSVLNYKEKKVY